MSFLGGLFLLALPLIAIPVVIHMMKKRQRDVIPWGAMQFLREPTRRGQRMSQMDRWLLLAARILILVCLIGSLAQPLLRWGQSISSDGLPMQLVMVDDTRSTLADNKFNSIRNAADQLIASFSIGTPVEVWAVGSPPRRITSDGNLGDQNATMSKSQMRSAIADFTPRGGDGNFVASVRQAVAASFDSNKGKQENETSTRLANSPLDVWLITDDTAAGWKPPLSSSAMIPGSNHRLHLMQVGTTTGENYQLSVAAVESSRRAVATNESVGLSASVVNFGSITSPEMTGVWTRDGEVFADEKIKPLEPGQRITIQTDLSIKDPGTHGITFELKAPRGANSDSLPADDTGHVVVQVVGVLPLLVIADARDSIGNTLGDADYLAAALGRNLGGWKSSDDAISLDAENENSMWQSLFRPEVYQIGDLSEVNWQRYPVIVWLGGSKLPQDVFRKLVSRVRQGAGLWITLDAHTNRESINDSLGSRGLGIASDVDRGRDAKDLGLVGRLVVNGAHNELQRLHPPDPSDAILSALSDTERLDLDVIRIRRRIELRKPRDKNASLVLLRTFEGDPIALLSSVGRGRVVLQALPMNPTWSNFPLSKSFVVWVLQVLDHLSQPVSEDYNIASGQMFRQRVDTIDHEFELTMPSGEKETLVALPQIGGLLGSFGEPSFQSLNRIPGVVRYDQTEQPGLYRVKDLDDEDAAEVVFSVVGDPNESNVSHHTTEIITALASDNRVDLHRSADGFDFDGMLSAIPKVDSYGTGGRPLWPAMLLGLVVAIAAETFLAGYAALRRYGRLRSSETEDDVKFGLERSVGARVVSSDATKTKETTV